MTERIFFIGGYYRYKIEIILQILEGIKFSTMPDGGISILGHAYSWYSPHILQFGNAHESHVSSQKERLI